MVNVAFLISVFCLVLTTRSLSLADLNLTCAMLNDAELCDLLIHHQNNQLLVDHTHYFQNSSGTGPRVYEIGVDQYTIADTPNNLRYRAFSAVGFGLANTIMVSKTNPLDGFILIDCGSSKKEVEHIVESFQKMGVLPSSPPFPLHAIIYTHNHIDHTGGSEHWIARASMPPCPTQNDAQDGTYFARQNCVEIISQKKVVSAVINTATRTGQQIDSRSAFMYGFFAIGGGINNGIGPQEQIQGATFQPPTKTLSEYLDLRILGLQLWIHYTPSETDDEIVVFAADGVNELTSAPTNPQNLSGIFVASAYQTPQSMGPGLLFGAEALQGPPTFPNLYSLRGTTFRNPLTWYQSMDNLRLYDSWCMVGSHGVPIMGSQHIQIFITNFRDAIQYVHDQTLRFIRLGLIPDELVEKVSGVPQYLIAGLDSISGGLPSSETLPLDPRDHLRSMYGSVPQSVRAIYAGYIGWNQGDPTFFNPLPPTERANRYMSLFQGGTCGAIEQAQHFYDEALNQRADGNVNWKQDMQWAAEILKLVVSSSQLCKVDLETALRLKAKALLQLARTNSTDTAVLQADLWTVNPNWRNWLVVGGQELALHSVDRSYPFFNGLSSTSIQKNVPPENWVREWCWRFNTTNTDALNGTRFGWEFKADEIFWGNETMQYVLEVAGKVVRLISDPTRLSQIWTGQIDIAVSVNYQNFSKLIENDSNKNRTQFVDTFVAMVESGEVDLLKGTKSGISNFYSPDHFDPVPPKVPHVVDRPVITEPLQTENCGCSEIRTQAKSEPAVRTGLEKLGDGCGGGCVLSLIIFMALFGAASMGMGLYLVKQRVARQHTSHVQLVDTEA